MRHGLRRPCLLFLIAEQVLDEQLSALIGHCYEAAADPAHWNHLATDLARVFHSHSAALALHRPDGEVALVDVTENFAICQADPGWTQHWASQDPWTAAAVRRAGAVSALGEDLVPMPELQRSGFYNEFASKLGLHHAVGSVFNAGPVGTVLLAAHRGRHEQAFDLHDLRRMNLLMPHLQRAFSLQHALGTAKGEASASLAALDRLQAVMMVVDDQRRLRVVNSFAEQWLRQGPGLRIQDGVLMASEVAMQERLVAAVAQVARQAAGGLAVAVEPLVFSPPIPGRAHMVLWVMPAPSSLADDGHVMLLQRQLGPWRNSGRARQLLHQLYRLTPREVDIVLALMEGESPLVASEQLEISLGHLRQRLKSIFQKVGVTSQAQLVARMGPLI